MFNSQGHNQLQRQQKPTVVHGLKISNTQPSQNPLNIHTTFQQQHQPQQKPQLV